MDMATYAVVNDAETRERLSRRAFQGFLRLADLWSLSTEERIDLLGASISRGTLNNWAKGETRPILSADALMRVSLLLGIYEGLQRIWRRSPRDADAWVRRPRVDGPFRGAQPLDFVRNGGIPALIAARTYVDGINGGPPSREDYAQPPRESL
jgi:hypothetical protein